nr:hypothetical protein [Micromonospora purpureochromogenes]
MANATITDALRAMRRLGTTSAGRLTGMNLDDAWRMPALASGAPGWPDGLNALLADRTAGTVTGDTPAYVVFSDGFPVCWLTCDAVTVVPPADLSRNQVKHRDLAVEALADLVRYALSRLADLRDVRDGRPDDVDSGYGTERLGMVRVADPACPARAWWVPVGADLPEARRRINDTIGGGEPLILVAHGYGDYGRSAHRLHLDVLCAINAAAEAHHLTGNVVGDWLAGEGGLAPGLVPADEVAPKFAEAFVGVFSHELSYTAFRLAETGWEAALRQLGAIEFFDTAKYNRHLFDREVRAITNSRDTGGGIVVCRRRQD